jgi:hypothetical protein
MPSSTTITNVKSGHKDLALVEIKESADDTIPTDSVRNYQNF